jgi:hypothetical protein
MRIHSPQITGSAVNTNIVLTTITSSISVLSSSFANTASYWSGSIINAASASYWSGSIINAASASYVLNAVSASYAATSSFADNLTVAGTLTAQTINVQTITSSIDYVTGSSINGSLLSNTHQITGSTSITGSLTVNDSNVILTNQTSSMSVATASYWSGSIINAESASYWSGSIINAATASYIQNAQSASYWSGSIINAASASYWSGSIINAESASYALTASYASNVPETASYALLANTASNANTASYVLNAVSASFALTASYISGSGGGVGFPFSGSAIVTGSLYVSGSTISGSFVGDGSGITGLTAGGKIHTQSSAASTWTVSHNLGVQYPNVTVYNASNEVIIPQTITATDANTLTLTFGSAVAGYAVSGIGGIINVQGRTTQQYFAAATTWSFAHNLGDRYVSLQAFDDAFEMMIPTTIRLVDATSSIMLFDSASSGYAVATIGGDLPAISSSYAGYTLQVANSAPYSASWVAVPNVTVTNAVSSSFAATASSADNLTVRGTLTAQTINVQTITSSIEFITGSTRNGSTTANTHEFTGSVFMSGSLNIRGASTFSGSVTAAGESLIGWGLDNSGVNSRVWGIRNGWSTGGDLAFITSATNNTTLDTTRLTITRDGNVGIGTSSPLSALDVRAASAINGNYQTIQAFSTDSAAINLGGGISLGGYYTGTSAIAQFGSIWGRKENSTSGNYNGYLAFGTNTQSVGVTERMRITSSGSILIGTSTDNSNGAGNILHQVAGETAALIHRGPYNIANGGTKTLDVQNGSLIFISENNTGDGALFHACYASATVTLIANPSGRYANTDTASKICVFKSAFSGTATLKNNAGSTFQFTTYIIKNSD